MRETVPGDPKGSVETARSVFAMAYAFYLLNHIAYLVVPGHGGLSTMLVGPIAFLVFVFPGNARLFALLIGVHLLDSILILPLQSNHLLMSIFLSVGIVLAYAGIALRERRPDISAAKHFQSFAPLGRWLLIVMYVYGTFHKVNADFLNPVSSCAVALWSSYGFPEPIARSGMLHMAVIYGTLALETLAVVMLLTRRLRYFGILLGVAFHGFLGFAAYDNYLAFSLLSISLHTLFLPAETGLRLMAGPAGPVLRAIAASAPRRIAIGALCLGLLLVLPRDLGWALVVGTILAVVALYGREPARPAGPGPWLISPNLAVNALVVIFFLNGLSPYAGFKTGQTISMFSNLTTEGGQSNHLLMPNWGWFGYQDDLVEIVETDHPLLGFWQEQGYQFVRFQVLDSLERGDYTATIRDETGEHRHSAQAPLPGLEALPPRALRNLMVFKPVDLSRPRPCDRY